jgi:flagellar protein FlaF
MPDKNPYTQASNAYGSTAAATDQRALEGKALLKAALQMERLLQRMEAGENVPREDISHAFEYNRKLWLVFVNETMNAEHPLPQEIKNNIASLGVFVFKRTIDAQIETTPAKVQPLIDINRSIASGLMKTPSASAQKTEKAPPAAGTSSSTDNLA